MKADHDREPVTARRPGPQRRLPLPTAPRRPHGVAPRGTRPTRAALSRSHTDPVRSPGVSCRHTQGLEEVWSARHVRTVSSAAQELTRLTAALDDGGAVAERAEVPGLARPDAAATTVRPQRNRSRAALAASARVAALATSLVLLGAAAASGAALPTATRAGLGAAIGIALVGAVVVRWTSRRAVARRTSGAGVRDLIEERRPRLAPDADERLRPGAPTTGPDREMRRQGEETPSGTD